MSKAAYLKEILSAFPELSRETGVSSVRLMFSFLRSFLIGRIELEEFRAFQLYNLSGCGHSQYLFRRKRNKISDILTAAATQEDLDIFLDKHLFNASFKEYIQRDWVSLADSTPDDIRAFLARNTDFLVKACKSTRGQNIYKYNAADISPDAFLREYQGKDYIAESFIRQHPALSAVNPTSVNTLRIVTAAKNGRVHIVGCGLRCGGSNEFVDNFHHGGAAYPVDLESGIVSGPGINSTGKRILRHPTTGHIMPGFQIPHWNELLKLVESAANHNPRVGYVGWDIAITEDGIDFIEGNINYPGNTVIQLDGPGAYTRLKQFLKAPSHD